MEPFTGQSLALPPTPETKRPRTCGAYCFGFDPSSKRYKIFHQDHGLDNDGNTKDDFYYVYTIGGGGGDNWRRVHAAGASRGHPVFADGSMWWRSIGTNQDQVGKVARLDLATEQITLLESMEVIDPDTVMDARLTTGSDARVHAVVTRTYFDMDVFCMGEGGRWAQYSSVERLPLTREIVWPHPLQQGGLLQERCGKWRHRGIYADPIASATASDDLGSEKQVLKITNQGCPEADTTPPPTCNNTPGLFVPVPCGQERKKARVRRVLHVGSTPRTFCYSPPVSPSHFSRYLEKL